MRFDVALFELRLARSRSQAAAAIQAGEARLNGNASKPSHEVRPGDRITLGARTVEVLALPARSVSREAAKELVRDLPPS
ncbi:MAG: S4 domain-containing protein [Candidatus Eisenbacteria bacterium]